MSVGVTIDGESVESLIDGLRTHVAGLEMAVGLLMAKAGVREDVQELCESLL